MEQTPIPKKRCPRGTHKYKPLGDGCYTKEQIENYQTEKKNKTIKKKLISIQEPKPQPSFLLSQDKSVQQPPVQEPVQEPVQQPLVQEPVQQPPVQEPVQQPVQQPPVQKIIIKKCPNGTHKYKPLGDGCYTLEQINQYQSNKKTVRLRPKKIVQQESVKAPVEAPGMEKILVEPAVEPAVEPVVEPIVENLIPVPPAPLPTDNENKHNAFQTTKEKAESNYYRENVNDLDFLYPTLDDPNFSAKIASRKEFSPYKYEGDIRNIKQFSDHLCRSGDFDLMPHQNFIKNFLSLNTPYNSILLYHGLGSGKTCSAIGIAEEMREYMKQVGITQRIMVIASSNVQENFKLQLFDRRKLKQTTDGNWSIQSCIGNKIINELNPSGQPGMPLDKIVNQASSIINSNYVFMGYTQLANYITQKVLIPVTDAKTYTEKQRHEIEVKNIRRHFNNRLIIIDEVHNALSDDKKTKKIAKALLKIAKYAENLRFVLLSATPMYNSYREIIWLTNLMNMNDKRATIDTSEVFDRTGEFKPAINDKESGEQLLRRKLNGYVSYVRGENPYTFPFRLYPATFAKEQTFLTIPYPSYGMNGKPLADDKKMKYLTDKIFLTYAGEEQSAIYRFMMEGIQGRSTDVFPDEDSLAEEALEEAENYGYTVLQSPIQATIMTFPSAEFDNYRENIETVRETMDKEAYKNLYSSLIGKSGLSRIMKWTEKTHKIDEENSVVVKTNYYYEPSNLAKYGRIFSPDVIGKYSGKIDSICKILKTSTGIAIVYVQYIDGGVLPMALALEEMGFTRYSSASYMGPLLDKKKNAGIVPIDAITMLPQAEHQRLHPDRQFKQAKYMILSGDKFFSHNNANDLKYATSVENMNGENVKCILITRAASEGLDFKYIRQVHILDPWYNMNRIEQIIGRGVRNMSHCGLPFEERNVEIYLHGTIIKNTANPGTEADMAGTDYESADVYIYRYAEEKARRIGRVTRILKEISVDCVLNIGQTNFTDKKLAELAENQNIQIHPASLKNLIQFQVGDKPYTDACDYMDNCEYKCYTDMNLATKEVPDTYTTGYMKIHHTTISDKIRELFRRETKIYGREQLFRILNTPKPYPLEQIYFSLTQLIQGENEILIDQYGRQGRLMNRGQQYFFRPLEIRDDAASTFDLRVPVDSKNTKLTYDLPASIQTHTARNAQPADNIGDESTKGEGVREKTVNASFDTIIEGLNEKYDKMTTDTPVKLKATDTDWYHHMPHLFEEFEDVFGIDRDTVLNYGIDHMFDELEWRDKLALLNKSMTGDIEFESDELAQGFKRWKSTLLLTVGERTATFLKTEDKLQIYIFDKEQSSFVEGIQEDLVAFEKAITNSWKVSRDRMSTTFGFMNEFKNRGIIFKMKQMTTNKNNIGAYLQNDSKTVIVTKLNDLIRMGELGEMVYTDENTTHMKKTGMCLVVEVLLRHLDGIKEGGKTWFYGIEKAEYNNVVKVVL